MNTKIAQVMFQRSHGARLDVVCYGMLDDHLGAGPDEVTRALDRLATTMQELYRIRNLEVISSAWSRKFVSGMQWLGRPAPQLRSLALDISSTFHGAPHDSPVPIFSLFQASNLSKLRSLHINDASHQWNTMLPYTLKVLEVSHARLLTQVGNGSWAFNPDLLSALSSVPRLEQLVIADASPADSCSHPLIPDNLPSVSLPHLRSLVLEASPLPSLVLLDKLDLPPSAHIQLNLAATEDLDVHSATSLLARPLCGHRSPPSQCSAGAASDCATRSFLVRFRDGVLTLAAWTSALPVPSASSTSLGPAPRLTASFALDADAETQRLQWSVITEDILEDLPFPAVSTLYLDALRPYTMHTDFRRALSGFSAVSTLVVDGWTTRALLALLYTTRAFSNELFLPALRTLVLRSVHFPRCVEGRRARAEVQQLALLVERLQQRRARGRGVEAVVLQGCFNVLRRDVGALQEAVGSVSWDGEHREGGAGAWKSEKVPNGMEYPWDAVASRT